VTARATRLRHEQCLDGDADVVLGEAGLAGLTLGFVGAGETVGRKLTVGVLVTLGRHDTLGWSVAVGV
jgi:hypothetical protein